MGTTSVSFDYALRLTALLLGFAYVLQSIEHLLQPGKARWLYAPRLLFAVMLVVGVYTNVALVGLLLIALYLLHSYQGPYNGGADRMGLLVLVCLSIASLIPSQFWQEIALGYLAIQLVLSYFISGWVKVVNPQWRSGQALEDVFAFSAYPAVTAYRRLASSPMLLFGLSWLVVVFELVFPLALLTPYSLVLALLLGACFHLSNAIFFGLNRFFWIWLAAYPSIIWLQQRILSNS
jgi:hypothetical protein